MRRVVMSVLLVAGCATPYQRMGLSGGYDDKELPNGDYLVTVKVNGYTGRDTALEYLHRRADELCPGGYDIVDRSDGDNGGILVSRNYVSQTHKPEVNAVVRCQSPAPPPPPVVAKAVAEERRTIVGERVLWCVTGGEDCYLDPTKCADGTCEQRNAGSCFNAVQILDGSKHTTCTSTIKGCEARRTERAADPDFRDITAQCVIYRVKVAPPPPATSTAAEGGPAPAP